MRPSVAAIDAKRDLSGMTLYVWPLMPCSVCAAMIVQTGISEVVAAINDSPRLAESCNFHLTEAMFDEAGVSLTMVEPSYLDGHERQT